MIDLIVQSLKHRETFESLRITQNINYGRCYTTK